MRSRSAIQQVHNFAKSLPRRDTTDHLDAHLLIIFAVERQPTLWSPPRAAYHELRQRLVTRDGVSVMRTHAAHAVAGGHQQGPNPA